MTIGQLRNRFVSTVARQPSIPRLSRWRGDGGLRVDLLVAALVITVFLVWLKFI